MTYVVRDAKGYLGDAASVGGWAAFAAWARAQEDDLLKHFVAEGWTAQPGALALVLDGLAAPAAVDWTRRALAELAKRADEVLILSDGLGDEEPAAQKFDPDQQRDEGGKWTDGGGGGDAGSGGAAASASKELAAASPAAGRAAARARDPSLPAGERRVAAATAARGGKVERAGTRAVRALQRGDVPAARQHAADMMAAARGLDAEDDDARAIFGAASRAYADMSRAWSRTGAAKGARRYSRAYLETIVAALKERLPGVMRGLHRANLGRSGGRGAARADEPNAAERKAIAALTDEDLAALGDVQLADLHQRARRWARWAAGAKDEAVGAFAGRVAAARDARVTKGDLLPLDVVRLLCPACADAMVEKGLGWLPLVALTDEARTLLREKVTDPGFFAHCVEEIAPKAEADDPEAFCAWLHEQLTGIWPGEHKAAAEPELTLTFGDPPAGEAAPLLVAKAAAAQEERRVVLGVVMEPDAVDTQGDATTAAEIELAAWRFMADYRAGKARLRLMHRSDLTDGEAVLVENYVAPVDFSLGGQAVKQGSWLQGWHVPQPDVWAAIKAGRLTGFSIGARVGTRPWRGKP